MSSAVSFNLDQSKILLSGNGLSYSLILQAVLSSPTIFFSKTKSISTDLIRQGDVLLFPSGDCIIHFLHKPLVVCLVIFQFLSNRIFPFLYFQPDEIENV